MGRVAAAKTGVKNLANQEALDIDTDEDEKPATKAKTKAAATSTDDLFPSLEDTTEYLNNLFYGREGSGKTTAACSAANHGQILVVNAEGGLKMKALQRQGVNTANIRVWPNPQSGTKITINGLIEVYNRIHADLIKTPGSWFAVVWDSATDITETLVGNVQELRLDKAEGRGVVLDENTRWETDRNDYGVMAKQFRDLMRKFRDLPTHFIVTALERRDIDEDSGLTTYGPAVSPALQTSLLGYVDLALFFRESSDEDGTPYRALTRKAGKNRAKDRLGSFPKVLAEPNFTRILQYANEELDPATDPVQDLLPKPAPPKAKAEKKQGLRAKKTTAVDTTAEDTDEKSEDE